MDLNEQINIRRDFGVSVCQRLTGEINKLGFEINAIRDYPLYDNASYELTNDPYTGKSNLTGFWYDTRNQQRIGRIQFNSDDSFYAEFNIIKPHPQKPEWFVEMVTAWGKENAIKAEAKLLPALE